MAFRSSLIQPIAVFAMKGAAPGHLWDIRHPERKWSNHLLYGAAKEQNDRIWFMQDVPHLKKCVRNFIYSGRKLLKANIKSTKKQKGIYVVVKKSPLPQDQQSVPFFNYEKIQLFVS
jgi:hypothetical protein